MTVLAPTVDRARGQARPRISGGIAIVGTLAVLGTLAIIWRLLFVLANSPLVPYTSHPRVASAASGRRWNGRGSTRTGPARRHGRRQ